MSRGVVRQRTMGRRAFTHRMYVDEVGNHHMENLQTVTDPNHRFLSLTGLIFELDHVRDFVAPQLEALKQKHFDSHPDHPVVLHRKEIVNKNFPFDALRDAKIGAAFDDDILALIRNATFTVLTVVIDKVAHAKRYKVFAEHPYHYCTDVLLERYAQWLEENKCTGDLIFEHRGTKENRELRTAIGRVFSRGTSYVTAKTFKAHVVAPVNFATKSQNIAGLQLADLIAHPAFMALRKARRPSDPTPSPFANRIINLIVPKYRTRNETIEGCGRKWLP